MAFIKNWFSNMYSCNGLITDDMGIEYHTVENYYQAAKTLDKEIRKAISFLNPYEAKKYGRKIKIRSDWDQVKLSIMEAALRQKFAPNTSYYDRLIGTGDEEIIEHNNWGDKYWGMVDGVGENHLGRLLMKIRAQCKAVTFDD